MAQSFNSPSIFDESSLEDCMKAHLMRESASFHTPGHKGHSPSIDSFWGDARKYDLTELPGLDDLSNPKSSLAQLEKKIAALWSSKGALLSVNGASACLVAALMAVCRRGQSILVPRNSHRSVINGLVLSGLKPIWYEPAWDEDWNLWGAVDPTTIAQQIEAHKNEGLAAVLVVSPTYSGCVSEMEKIAEACHFSNLPLIVDEAHGAYRLENPDGNFNAIEAGADLIVHSLHKHLGASTQTGVLHLGRNAAEKFALEKEDLRNFLSLLQSTSPNYLLLSSIAAMVDELNAKDGRERLDAAVHLAASLKTALSADSRFDVYQPTLASPLHLLMRVNGHSPTYLETHLQQMGIFAEAILGDGVLLMLGIGSSYADVETLLACLDQLANGGAADPTPRDFLGPAKFLRPPLINQVMSPREAFLRTNHFAPGQQSEGLVAAQCIAPCPPGWPVVVPGQKLGKNEIENAKVEYLRVVTPDN